MKDKTKLTSSETEEVKSMLNEKSEKQVSPLLGLVLGCFMVTTDLDPVKVKIVKIIFFFEFFSSRKLHLTFWFSHWHLPFYTDLFTLCWAPDVTLGFYHLTHADCYMSSFKMHTYVYIYIYI